MKAAIFQPSYPHEGTIESAQQCMDWIYEQLEKLEGKRLDLVVLPEYSNSPGITDGKAAYAFIKEQAEVFTKKISDYAIRINSTIIACMGKIEDGNLKNCAVFFSPEGKCVYSYEKLHLSVAESAKGIVAGNELGFFEYAGLKLGFAICFDIYFPEYIVALARKQIDILICPSYQRGEESFRIEAMTRTRAIDSGAWILRSSYAIDKDSTKGGHSMIVSPAGEILANAGNMPGVKILEFNPEEKFIKPASFRQAPVIHRDLMERTQRPYVYNRK